MSRHNALAAAFSWPSLACLLRFSRTSLLALQVTVVATAWAQSTQSGLTGEEKLEAIRQGLVQAALEGATHVDSLTWIDGQGVLREGSSFRSGMEVRGVQVLSYRRDSTGQPQAQLKLPTRKDVVRDNLSPVPPCGDAPALRHLMGLRMTIDGGWSVEQAPLAQALGQVAATVLQQVGNADAAWVMLERSAPARTGYERVLVGTSADQLPWQAYLSVKPAKALPLTRADSFFEMLPISGHRPVIAQLHFSVLARGQVQPLYEASADIEIPRPTQAWSRPQLDASVREKAWVAIQPWSQALEKQFSCAAVRPDVIAVRGAELSINAGALAGVRAGEEWLLADPQRFPQQILTSGVAATSVLARVGQVFPLHAQLQIVAGPADQVRTDWRAWRADSPISLSNIQR